MTASVVFTVTFSASPAVLWQSFWTEITMHLSDALTNALCIFVLNLWKFVSAVWISGFFHDNILCCEVQLLFAPSIMWNTMICNIKSRVVGGLMLPEHQMPTKVALSLHFSAGQRKYNKIPVGQGKDREREITHHYHHVQNRLSLGNYCNLLPTRSE